MQEPLLCRAVVIPTKEQFYPWPHRSSTTRTGSAATGLVSALHPYRESVPRTIALTGDLSELDLGTVVAAICAYSTIGFDDQDHILPDAAAVFAQTRKDPLLIMHGGIEVLSGERVVLSPGCCCALEDWREWIRFAEGGPPADSGHDPPPLVERLPSGRLRIGHKTAPEAAIEVAPAELRMALRATERELAAFVAALSSWAGRLAPIEAEAFVAVVDRAFGLTSVRGGPTPRGAATDPGRVGPRGDERHD